jgi:AAA15 family ATPase/GTPase
MLIEFSVENYLSFKDLTTISMVAAKSFKEHMGSNIIQSNSNVTLLKSAIIYGNNASGKSNLLEAMAFMKATVLNSFREALMENGERKFPLQKFVLDTQTEKESSFFEVLFVHHGVKYRYGFELDHDKVIAEWLYHTTSKEVYLFKRELQKIEINKTALREGLGKEGDVKENVLFLSLLATLGKETASSIIDWFKKYNIVTAIRDFGYKQYTIDKLKNDKLFFNWVSLFLKYLEISNLATIEDTVARGNDDKNENKNTIGDRIIAYHRKYNEHNILVDTVAFDFDSQESEGTKKLLYLLGPWYDTLQNGKILVIDELESRLHRNLTVKLIEFFHLFNENAAQLIGVVQDTSLLNKDIFRRDQIWFMEKNQFGASELFSLADFKTDKVRNKSAFDKNYLDGKYGAIPYFESNDELKQLLYARKEQQV